MERRSFIQLLFATLGMNAVGSTTTAAKPTPRILIQETSVAGFQHHQGERLWQQLAVGQQLRLAREPDNPHDKRAVAVYRGGAKLGYLPRQANYSVAQMLERAQPLRATLIERRQDSNPWRRLRVRIEAAPHV